MKFGSSTRGFLYKRVFLKNSLKFTGKQELCQSLFLNRDGHGACNFIKKNHPGTGVFL